MEKDIILSTEEFDQYTNIDYRGKQYRVHYQIMPQHKMKICPCCNATQDIIEWYLNAIGAIYSTSGYYEITPAANKQHSKIVQVAIEQIRKNECHLTFDQKYL